MTKSTVATANDTLYARFVTAATEFHRQMEHSNLVWYWNMGDLHAQFEAGIAQDRLGNRTIDNLIEDLAARDIHLATSTLYMARQIHDAYKREALLDMVQRGVMVSHIKLLLPLKDSLRDQVEGNLHSGGKILSVVALSNNIDKLKQKALAKETKAALKYVASAPDMDPADDLLAEAPEDANGLHRDAKDAKDARSKNAKPVKATKGDKPTKPTAEPTGGKNFTVSPIKAFSAADQVALKLTERLPDVIIAAKELAKIGYDSEAAQRRAKDALKDVHRSLKTLAQTLDEVLIALAKARDEA